MTTLQLQLDDDLNAFVQRRSHAQGHSTAGAYIESLIAIERLKDRPQHVTALLQEALDDPMEAEFVDDDYWKRLEAEVFGSDSADVAK